MIAMNAASNQDIVLLDAHSTLKALHWKGYPPLLDWDAYQPSTTITVHTEGEKH